MATPTQKREIILKAIDAAIHIILESDLPHTDLWPKDGICAGWGERRNRNIEAINVMAMYSETIYGIERFLIVGYVCFGREKGILLQQQIKLILDQAIYDNVYFELKPTIEYPCAYPNIKDLYCDNTTYIYTIN